MEKSMDTAISHQKRFKFKNNIEATNITTASKDEQFVTSENPASSISKFHLIMTNFR